MRRLFLFGLVALLGAFALPVQGQLQFVCTTLQDMELPNQPGTLVVLPDLPANADINAFVRGLDAASTQYPVPIVEYEDGRRELVVPYYRDQMGPNGYDGGAVVIVLEVDGETCDLRLDLISSSTPPDAWITYINMLQQIIDTDAARYGFTRQDIINDAPSLPYHLGSYVPLQYVLNHPDNPFSAFNFTQDETYVEGLEDPILLSDLNQMVWDANVLPVTAATLDYVQSAPSVSGSVASGGLLGALPPFQEAQEIDGQDLMTMRRDQEAAAQRLNEFKENIRPSALAMNFAGGNPIGAFAAKVHGAVTTVQEEVYTYQADTLPKNYERFNVRLSTMPSPFYEDDVETVVRPVEAQFIMNSDGHDWSGFRRKLGVMAIDNGTGLSRGGDVVTEVGQAYVQLDGFQNYGATLTNAQSKTPDAPGERWVSNITTPNGQRALLRVLVPTRGANAALRSVGDSGLQYMANNPGTARIFVELVDPESGTRQAEWTGSATVTRVSVFASPSSRTIPYYPERREFITMSGSFEGAGSGTFRWEWVSPDGSGGLTVGNVDALRSSAPPVPLPIVETATEWSADCKPPQPNYEILEVSLIYTFREDRQRDDTVTFNVEGPVDGSFRPERCEPEEEEEQIPTVTPPQGADAWYWAQIIGYEIPCDSPNPLIFQPGSRSAQAGAELMSSITGAGVDGQDYAVLLDDSLLDGVIIGATDGPVYFKLNDGLPVYMWPRNPYQGNTNGFPLTVQGDQSTGITIPYNAEQVSNVTAAEVAEYIEWRWRIRKLKYGILFGGAEVNYVNEGCIGRVLFLFTPGGTPLPSISWLIPSDPTTKPIDELVQEVDETDFDFSDEILGAETDFDFSDEVSD